MSGELEKVEGGGNGSEPQRLGKRGKVIVGMIVVLNIIAICVGFALVSRSFDMTISATTTTTTSTTTASTLAPPARCWGSGKKKQNTERQIKVCTWLREICSCSCLTVLPGPAWVLLSKTCKPYFAPLYIYFRETFSYGCKNNRFPWGGR